MRWAARVAIGTASACALALCGLALATGLVVIVATVRAHEWLEGESPATRVGCQ